MRRFLFCLISLIFLTSCTPSYRQVNQDNSILFIPKSQISSFWEITIDGYNTAIAEYNEDGVVLSTLSEEDIDGQIDIVNNAVIQGYDAIIISALSYEELANSVQHAIDEGVEVVVIDSDVNVDDVKVRISTDNYNAGFKMGETVAELMNYSGYIGVLAFDIYTQNLEDRIKGFRDAIETFEQIEIVQTEQVYSTHADAMSGTTAIIENNSNLDAIVTFNEITTVAMGQVIHDKGREDLVAVGFDNNSVVVNFLETGVLDAIIVQNQFAMGYLGAEYAIKLLNDEIDEHINIDTGVNIVTRDNIFNEEIQTILFPFEISH